MQKCIPHFDKLLYTFCIQTVYKMYTKYMYTKCIPHFDKLFYTKCIQNICIQNVCKIFVYKMFTKFRQHSQCILYTKFSWRSFLNFVYKSLSKYGINFV